MRMFLVVMCDMFLLLYLTALAQIDATPVSDLTVKDYLALKRAEEDIRKESESKELALVDQAKRAATLEARLRTLEEEVKRAAEEKRRLSAAVQGASANLEEAKKQQLEQKKIEASLRSEAAKQAELAKSEASRAAEERRRLESENAEQERQAAAMKRQAEDLARRAEEAKIEAERAKEEAKKSQEEAEKAAGEKSKALELAKLAKEREASALSLAGRASVDAERAKGEAAQAEAIAEHAQKERSQITERFKAITQRADAAFQKNVRGKLLTVTSEVETKNLLIGRTKRTRRLAGVAVSVSGEKVIVVPLEQAGIDPGEDESDYTSLKFSVDGKPVRRAFVSPASPRALALVVGEEVPAGETVPKETPLGGMMPTLIALRNGADLEFRDRIRGLDGERFVFQRDRLRAKAGGILTYEASGFRGTGDFGERIVKGDQVVDLDGNFIGLAIEDGRILRVTDFNGWKEVRLGGKASELVRALAK